MSTTPEQDKDVLQLKKEKLELEAQVQALKKEAYNLQLENDVLKKAAEILKKDQGIWLICVKLTFSIDQYFYNVAVYACS